VSHLNSVADTPELRAAYNAACPGSPSSGPAWAPTSACTPSTRPSTLPAEPEQRQAHRNAVRNFVLSGAELTGAAKERFAEIQERRPN
jgi:oligopeptidase A